MRQQLAPLPSCINFALFALRFAVYTEFGIDPKMTLLATSSSTTEKKISKQGFRIDKFRMPVDAVIFSLGM